MLLQSWHNQVHISSQILKKIAIFWVEIATNDYNFFFQCLEHVLLIIICMFNGSTQSAVHFKSSKPIHFVNFISFLKIFLHYNMFQHSLIGTNPYLAISSIHFAYVHTFQKPGRAVKYLNWLCKGSLTFCNHF